MNKFKLLNKIRPQVFLGLSALFSLVGILVVTAFFEAHFALKEGKMLLVYTADFLRSYFCVGDWHYAGTHAMGGLSVLLEHWVVQFFGSRVGIYLGVLGLGGLWLYGWHILGKKWGVGPLWRGCLVFPLAAFVYLFLCISPKLPEGSLLGVLLALWLSVGVFALWGSRLVSLLLWVLGCACMAYLGFIPGLFFALCTGISLMVKVYGRQLSLGRGALVFCIGAFLWGVFPMFWARTIHAPVSAVYSSYVWRQWKSNGISKDWSLYLAFCRTQRANRDQNYTLALQEANYFWFSKKGVGSSSLSMGERYFRSYLAEETKLALVLSGELNQHFLDYSAIPEMTALYYGRNPLVPVYNATYFQFYWQTGALTAAAFEGVNLLENAGLSAQILPCLAQINTCLGQYALSEKYLHLLRHTLFYRSWAQEWTQVNNSQGTGSALVAQKRREMSTRPSAFWGKNPDIEMPLLGQGYPRNLAVLEYINLNDLLYKRLDSLWLRLPDYRRLNYSKKHLPAYIQEAILLYGGYGLKPEAQNLVRQEIEGFSFDPQVVKSLDNFLGAKQAFETGRLSPQDFMDRFGSTYAFFFFFQRTVSAQEMAAAAAEGAAAGAAAPISH